jgi:hypothetical protein
MEAGNTLKRSAKGKMRKIKGVAQLLNAGNPHTHDKKNAFQQ